MKESRLNKEIPASRLGEILLPPLKSSSWISPPVKWNLMERKLFHLSSSQSFFAANYLNKTQVHVCKAKCSLHNQTSTRAGRRWAGNQRRESPASALASTLTEPDPAAGSSERPARHSRESLEGGTRTHTACLVGRNSGNGGELWKCLCGKQEEKTTYFIPYSSKALL